MADKRYSKYFGEYEKKIKDQKELAPEDKKRFKHYYDDLKNIFANKEKTKLLAQAIKKMLTKD